MTLSKTNCKQIFREAYENRYTWPKTFNGFKGKCSYISDSQTIEGDFIVGKSYKPVINNILNKDIEKMIGSQLFEVVIHRIRKSFDEIHTKNDFQFESEDQKGIQMIVIGKNEGDKYRVKDKSINMVYRRMHGIVIEIFVKEFIDTNYGLLSQKYSSIQLDQNTLVPKSQKLYYNDKFKDIGNGLWVLSSREISYKNKDNEEKTCRYIFNEISLLN